MARVLGADALAVSLALLYLAAGAGVALALSRRGHPAATAVSALAIWPLLLSLTRRGPAARAPAGPMSGRIAACFEATFEALADAGDAAPLGREELAGLLAALQRADARLAAVDRLLARGALPDSADPGVRDSALALRQARARSAGEIEAVLAGVLQLRLQIGLLALAGDDRAARQRLAELRDRARALEELTPIPSPP